MASSHILSTVVIFVVLASTHGFKIENPDAIRNYKYQSTTNFFSSTPSSTFKLRQSPPPSFINQPIAGYPKTPPPNAHLAGGHEDDLLPPFQDSGAGFSNLRSQSFRRSIQDVKVDAKTGYPLVAEPSWKFAGGNEESLELPLEDSKTTAGQDQEAVDPKTGYPLVAQPGWKHAGGDGEILELPFEDSEKPDQGQEAVDPKTGYPLVANPSWKFAGGDGEILQLPLDDSQQNSDEGKVDPKTGYPLVAQPEWRDAGGDGDILQLPLDDSTDQDQVPVDPKTGYPLIAQPSWKDAGGDGDIIELPFEDTDPKPDEGEVDPKTGYPLVAQPSWKFAGGDGDILELPLEDSNPNPNPNEGEVDPKTGYPLVAQPSWKFAGGDGDILELPLEDSKGREGKDLKEKVDPKTGYPLVAKPSWKLAGGDGDILELPLEESNSVGGLDVRAGPDPDEDALTELRPPSADSSFSTFFNTPPPPAPTTFTRRSPPQPKTTKPTFPINQRTNSFGGHQQFGGANRPIESTYTYTGPENVVVTVTRFLNTQTPEGRSVQGNKSGSTSPVFQKIHFQNNLTTKPPFSFQNNFGKTNTQQINKIQQNAPSTQFQFNQRPTAIPQNFEKFQFKRSQK